MNEVHFIPPKTLDALEVCLLAQGTGVAAEQALSLYPGYASVLRMPLEGAALARALQGDGPSAESAQRVRTRLLGYAASLRRQQRRRTSGAFLPGMNRLAWAVFLAVLVLVVSGYGLYSAAAQSLPGESLYPVKRTLESVRLQLAAPEQRHVLEETYNQRRLDEVQALIHNRRSGYYVTFWGTVEEQRNTRWVVDSVPVQLAADVRIIGDMKVGMVIEVEGVTTSEGWILARELHLNRRDLVGDVERIGPTEWTVNGVTFKVNDATDFDGIPAEGDSVLVTLQAEEDGSLMAMRIIRLVPLDPTQTPEIAPTPLPTYTPTPGVPPVGFEPRQAPVSAAPAVAESTEEEHSVMLQPTPGAPEYVQAQPPKHEAGDRETGGEKHSGETEHPEGGEKGHGQSGEGSQD